MNTIYLVLTYFICSNVQKDKTQVKQTYEVFSYIQ